MLGRQRKREYFAPREENHMEPEMVSYLAKIIIISRFRFEVHREGDSDFLIW